MKSFYGQSKKTDGEYIISPNNSLKKRVVDFESLPTDEYVFIYKIDPGIDKKN